VRVRRELSHLPARIGMQRARELSSLPPPSSIPSEQGECGRGHAHGVNGPATRSSTLGTRSRKLNFLINDTRAHRRPGRASARFTTLSFLFLRHPRACISRPAKAPRLSTYHLRLLDKFVASKAARVAS